MPDLGRSAVDDRRSSPGGTQLEEAELVRRAQLGSSGAFEQLVRQRGPDLYRYLFTRLRNESDVHDALQETMTAAWQALPSLRDAEKYWPWVVAIAARKASEIARKRVNGSDEHLHLLVVEDDGMPDVRMTLESLPAPLSEMLVLRYRLQLSEQEVADVLGIRKGTVKSRVARARKAAMELLQ